MSDMPTKWKSLPKYQQIKYIAEIIAICGGLVLLFINAYQLKLLAQSNAINMEMFKSTFPIEIESSVIEYTDKQPIVLKIKLTNVVNQRLYIQPGLPKMVLSDSNEIKNAFKEITTKVYKEDNTKSISSPHNRDRKVTLKPSESCVLEITVNLNIPPVYSEKNILKYKPGLTTFIMLPLDLVGLERQSSRTILVSLSRDGKKSLILSSDILRHTDIDYLIQTIMIERIQLSLPEWD